MNEALDPVAYDRAKYLNKIPQHKLDKAEDFEKNVQQHSEFLKILSGLKKAMNPSNIKSLYKKDYSNSNIEDWLKKINRDTIAVVNGADFSYKPESFMDFVSQLSGAPDKKGMMNNEEIAKIRNDIIPAIYKYYENMLNHEKWIKERHPKIHRAAELGMNRPYVERPSKGEYERGMSPPIRHKPSPTGVYEDEDEADQDPNPYSKPSSNPLRDKSERQRGMPPPVGNYKRDPVPPPWMR